MKNILCVVLFSLLLFACNKTPVYHEETGSVFHTVYHFKYKSTHSLKEKIEQELAQFDLSLNPFNRSSILAKINRNEEVKTDAWFEILFNKSMEVSKNSNGCFDATSAPLINLWGFGFEEKSEVTQHLLDSLMMFVGYQKVRLDNHRVIKDDPRIQLNFSAIAKGFSCDVVASLLEREGVTDYMVEIGGEVVTKGVNPHGDCWHVGINKPQDDLFGINQELEVIVELCEKRGLATSGNYRNYYMKDGVKYGHTINPFTGYPAENSLLSATVIASDCMTADAYATAFMVMGLEAAVTLADTHPELDYFFIYGDSTQVDRTLSSANFQKMIVRDR